MNQPFSNMTPAEVRVDRLKTVVAIGGAIMCAGLFLYGFKQKNVEKADLAAYPRYTIGEITKTGVVISPSSHGYSLFTYQVGDSTYTKEGPDEVPAGHTRFLIKFSTKHPAYYQFYEQVPIPYTIDTAPAEGWETPPFPVPSEVLD